MPPRQELSINVGGRLMSLDSPKVMGILNATPDSFFAGSRCQTERDIARRAEEITAQGGHIIDIGACSTRPGAGEVSYDEEKRRIKEALSIVAREQPQAVMSVDTFRPDIARMAVEEYGAAIINDVSEGSEAMYAAAAQLHVPYILTSRRPTLSQTLRFFAERAQRLRDLGARDIIIDPGFGFGKTMEENYALLAQLERLAILGLPMLVGISRKSMVYRLLNTTPAEALNGTTALNALALAKGAKILRVHDVKEASEVVMELKELRGVIASLANAGS